MEEKVINDCLTSVEGIYESVVAHSAPVRINVSKEEYVPGSIDEMVGYVEAEEDVKNPVEGEEKGDNPVVE